MCPVQRLNRVRHFYARRDVPLLRLGTYRAVSRPPDTSHRHPVLVFDRDDRLHLPLTVYAKEAATTTSDKTANTYLSAVLPFFTFLEVDEWQVRAERRWDGPVDQVRQAVHDYLGQCVRCRVRQHAHGFQLVEGTAESRTTVHVFLSALKLFYRVMMRRGVYLFAENPLVDSVSVAAAALLGDLEAENREFPRMPQISGVEEPHRRKYRLSDSYFKLQGDDWVPQVIDDVNLPGKVLAGGSRLRGWGLREECVTRILFESGGRISEVVGLTLGDWYARGLKQEATATSKGSRGKRVKFLRWDADTAKLLRQYFETERRTRDLNGHGLAEYVRLAERKEVDLLTIPLFLSAQRTALSAKTFRENYWNKACKAARIEADPHQARHWYVTMAVRTIHETSRTDGEVQRRLRELIEYMKWKSGWEMIEVYEHYFDAQRHAEVQDRVHALLEKSKQQAMLDLEQRRPRRAKSVDVPTEPSTNAAPDEAFDFLMSLGGTNDER